MSGKPIDYVRDRDRLCPNLGHDSGYGCWCRLYETQKSEDDMPARPDYCTAIDFAECELNPANQAKAEKKE